MASFTPRTDPRDGACPFSVNVVITFSEFIYNGHVHVRDGACHDHRCLTDSVQSAYYYYSAPLKLRPYGAIQICLLLLLLLLLLLSSYTKSV